MIYIDTPRKVVFRRRTVTSAHLGTDGPIEQLHVFAKEIGLKRSWFQKHDDHPHYDLIGKAAIKRALKAGAAQVSPMELLKKIRGR